MSAHTSGEWMLLYITISLLAVFTITFGRNWAWPLRHGVDFFLGVKVAPGFYEGEGTRWLRNWHAVVLAWYLLAIIAAIGVFLSGRWFLFPAWAGGNAVLYVSTLGVFTAYARARLGTNPPVLSSVAVPLEARRLGDSISWRAETLIGAITVLSWVLLLVHGDARTHWNAPVVLTYVIWGLLPFKIVIARYSVPIPAERSEEHYRWIEASRRYWLRDLDLFRLCFLVLLGGYALLHGGPLAGAWLRWLLTGVFLAVVVSMAVAIIRGERRLTAMGRSLMPADSYSTPFRRARLMPPGFVKWYLVWFGGLVVFVLLAIFGY